VQLGHDPTEIDRVDALAGRVDRDAGQALEPGSTADTAQEAAVRAIHDDGARADVGDVEVAGGVEVQADRLDELAGPVFVADARVPAARDVEHSHVARHGVGHEDAAAVHCHRIRLHERLPGHLLAGDEAAQLAARWFGDDVGARADGALVDEARRLGRRRKNEVARRRRRGRHGQRSARRQAQNEGDQGECGPSHADPARLQDHGTTKCKRRANGCQWQRSCSMPACEAPLTARHR
jgi:hypothetical protein